jgi:hypothetical protein
MHYPDPTALTPAQKKAVDELKKAFAAAKRANVYFYQVLDSVHALNGRVVHSVVTDSDSGRADCSMREFDYPEMITFGQLNPFSDDEHFVIFKDSAKKRVSEDD